MGQCPACPRRSRASPVREFRNGGSNLAVGGRIVPDVKKVLPYVNRETGGVAPPIKVNPLRSLPIHRLGARSCLGLGRGPIPSFQMAKRLLDVPPGKFVRDHLTNVLRPRIPICTERFVYLPLHRAGFVASELPGSAE